MDAPNQNSQGGPAGHFSSLLKHWRNVRRLTQIELGNMKEIDTDTLAKLCAFYKVGVGDILEYNPDGIQTTGHAARDLLTA